MSVVRATLCVQKQRITSTSQRCIVGPTNSVSFNEKPVEVDASKTALIFVLVLDAWISQELAYRKHSVDPSSYFAQELFSLFSYLLQVVGDHPGNARSSYATLAISYFGVQPGKSSLDGSSSLL